VRPYNFEQRNLQLLNEIEENRALRIIDANNELDDTNKMTEVAKYVSKMADRTFSLVAKSITSITVAKTGESVTDPQYIAEFLKGITQAQASVIMEKIKELNESGPAAKSSFICSNCGNEWDQPLDFDPTTFFG
jgi:glycerol-3-phosphate dehydrogenase